MAYLSLYRKYRPQTFAELLGQEHVATTLSNAIVEDRVAHAYLFTGPRGTGKTSTARILAKALNCAEGPTPTPCGVCPSCVAITEGSSLDVIEMDAASHSKVDETRDILSGVPLATAGGRRKVYVIDEVHMLSTPAFNALLKTLEEPPPHVVFILATTEAHKVPATIISRTQRFDFRRVATEELEALLAKVAEKEKVDADPAALSAVARRAEGSARDALSALDQLGSLGGPIGVADAERLLGERHEDALGMIFQAITDNDVGALLGAVSGLVAQGADVRRLALGALERARHLLLVKTAPGSEELLDLSEAERAELVAAAELFETAELLRAIELLAAAITDMREAPNHRLLLEVALIRATAPETDVSAAGLLGRIERLERRLSIATSPADATPSTPESTTPPRRGATPAAVTSPRRQDAASGATRPARAVTPKPKRASATEPRAHTDEVSPPESVPTPQDAVESDLRTVPPQVGLAHIKDSWQTTLAGVNKRSRRVGAFLNPSRPIRFEGGSLIVEVQSEFHRETMSEDRHRAVLLDALNDALGIKPSVAFVAKDHAAAIAPEAVAEIEDSRNSSEEHDPVELVKRGLAAEVVEEI
ncbi:MAG: DNA polymerase III subunit gamma/tau [Actinomycetota bacterium]